MNLHRIALKVEVSAAIFKGCARDNVSALNVYEVKRTFQQLNLCLPSDVCAAYLSSIADAI